MTTETKSNRQDFKDFPYNRRIALNAPRQGSKGRNGTFSATEVVVVARAAPDEYPLVVLSAHSRRTSNSAPLLLVLDPGDAVLLAEALQTAAEATLPADLQAVIRA